MNPSTGTFTTMDTYQGSIFDPTSLHKYLYANANPVMNSDPSGYATLTGTQVAVLGATFIAAAIASNSTWAMNVYKNIRSSFAANSYFVPKYIFQIDDVFVTHIASGILTSADANDEVSSEITSGTGAASPDPKNNKNKKNKNGDSSKSNEKQEHNAKGEEKTNSQQRNKWIKHDVYNKVRNRFGKEGVDKFIRAMKKGLISQSEYDEMASDFYANDPRALQTLVNDHGVKALQFPDEILEAGAKAASEIINTLRSDGDALTKEMVESYAAALPLLRGRTEGTDMPFLRAREKFFKL